MWFIKDAAGKITYLWPNKTLIVGRKQCDIILERGESISKRHASITVTPKSEFRADEPTSTCIVQDIGSKYGSFILEENRSRRISAEGCTLNPSNKVKFGLQRHIFEFHYVPIIVTSSTLSDEEKVELQNIINTVDGFVVSDWKDTCTHLTVANVTITAKVACSLASGIPIVNMAYWRAVVEAMEENKTLPSTENFTPTITERNIDRESVSLSPNSERKTLFKDKIFVCFSSQQHKCYYTMIKSAGGRLLLYARKPLQSNELCGRNVIVIQFASDVSQLVGTSSTVYESIQEALQAKRRRMIPEHEIPLAILYCSIAQMCNPKFAYAQLLNVRNQPHDARNSTILAVDTQDLAPPPRPVPIIINETLASQQISTPYFANANPSPGKKTIYINESSQSSCEFDSLPRKGVAVRMLRKNAIDTEHPQASTSGRNDNNPQSSKNIRKKDVIIINETVEDSEPSENITKCYEILAGDRCGASASKDDVKKRERSDLDDEITAAFKKPHLDSKSKNQQSSSSKKTQQFEKGAGVSQEANIPCLTLDMDGFEKSSETSNKKHAGKRDSKEDRESTGKLKDEVNSDPKAIQVLLAPDQKFAQTRNANSKSNQTKPPKSSWLDIDDEMVKKPSENINSISVKRSYESSFSEFESPLNKPSTSKASTEKQLKLGNNLELVSRDKRTAASNFKKDIAVRKMKSSKSLPIEDDGWIVPKADNPNRTLNSTSPAESYKSDRRIEIEDNSEDENDQFGFVNEEPRGKVKKKDDDDPWAFIDDPNAKSDSDECPFGMEFDKIKKEDTKEREGNVREKKKKRRHRSSSSERSAGHADSKQFGKNTELTKSDSDVEVTGTFRCKTNDMLVHNCTSTITSLLRKDIDVNLDSSDAKVKMFIKIYDKTPAKRITFEDLYVWKSQKIIQPDDVNVESSDSSQEEADDFNFTNSKVGSNKRTTVTRGRVRA